MKPSLLIDLSIFLTICGLAIISGLEAWRPGVVSGAVNLSLVLVAAMVLLGFGLLIKREINSNKK